jgi:L-fuculose-phosphate aldolase
MTNESEEYTEAQQQIVDYSNLMLTDDLAKGTFGNISVRVAPDRIAVTPTGVDYPTMTADDVPIVDLEGKVITGRLKPSSEAPMHRAIYQQRGDVKAIVHTHSPYATVYSILGRPIPAVHYVVGRLGGASIPVTSRYELFGSTALAERVVEALGDIYTGALLRNHGAVAVGTSLKKAYSGALNIESMAQLAYLSQCLLGSPQLLSDDQMHEEIRQFEGYEQKPEGSPQLLSDEQMREAIRQFKGYGQKPEK